MTRARRGVPAALAALLTCGLAAQSCGIMSPSADCTQRATCPGDDGAGPGDSTVDAFDEESSDAVGEQDAVSEGEAGDSGDASEAAAEAEASDSAGDAARDVISEDSNVGDVVSEEASRSDACVPGATEDCTNGIDDDCDGLVDCADPECKAFTCIAPLPNGWSGPVELWQAATPATPPGCDPSYGSTPKLANGGTLTAPKASCSACSCSPSGQVCASISGALDGDLSCRNPCATLTLPSGSCVAVTSSSCGSSFSMQLSPPSPSGGACNPSGGNATVPAATWDQAASLCTYQGPTDDHGGCPASDVCVAKPSSPPYGSTPCVYWTGSGSAPSCPTGYTGSSFVFYQGIADTRGCTACSCTTASPSGGSCSGTVGVFGGTSCSGTPPVSYTLGSPCASETLTSPPMRVQGNYSVATPGACASAGASTPTGAAIPASPLTVCCQ